MRTGAAVKPIITVSPVNDELLAAVGRLTGEYGKIGGSLNQIARYLNEYGAPYSTPAGGTGCRCDDRRLCRCAGQLRQAEADRSGLEGG